MINLIFLFLLAFSTTTAQKLDSKEIRVIAEFDVRDMFKDSSENLLDEKNIEIFLTKIPSNEKHALKHSQFSKIFVFNQVFDKKVLSQIPKQKLVYFLMEPWEISSSYYDLYGKVYTWNDDLVDNKKFFKLYFPNVLPMIENIVPFEQKKLCVMVAGQDISPKDRKNDLYSERMQMVEFFEKKPKGEFEFYGMNWKKRFYRDYMGSIPGSYCGDEKTATLKNYKFSICFENTKNINGYVTEKIFSCFAAGCVPIYWGAKNIENYIPRECYVDYRDFPTRESLYQYIKQISENDYQNYLDNIQFFLQSEKAKLFTPDRFQKMFYDATN